MKFFYIIMTFTLLFSYSSVSEVICTMERACGKADLKANVDEAYDKCRNLIASVDNIKREAFEPSVAFYHLRTKSALKELQKKLNYAGYLNTINDSKTINGKQKTSAYKKIDEWQDTSAEGIHKLGMSVSEDLRAMASFCVQPISFIKDHVKAIADLVKDKT